MRLNDYTVPSTNLQVRQGFTIQSKSLGGNSSGTDSAQQGIKPKVLRVSLLVRYEDAVRLKGLVNIAEARDDNGDLITYTITDRTANTTGVKQVVFDGEFSAIEDDDINAWRIKFSLKEKKSTAEKVEQRQNLAAASDQTIATSGVQVAGDEALKPIGFIESQLAKVERVLS